LRALSEPEEDILNPSNIMMPQKTLEFTAFEEAAAYFYKRFSESAPLRFEPYLQSSGGREIEAIAKYLFNLQLNESLLPCLHAAELALRNSIHLAMIQMYLPSAGAVFPDGQPADDEWWFDVEVRGAKLLKAKDLERVTDAFYEIPKNGKPITPRVVAQLPFDFWVKLLSSSYDEKLVVPMLKTTMKGVQKSNPPNRTHSWLTERFDEIKGVRNRVFHHEPVYHLENLQFINTMAWQLAGEMTPGFRMATNSLCRFNDIRSAGWQAHSKPARAIVQNLYNTYKKEPADA
jgi:hypothetical protein